MLAHFAGCRFVDAAGTELDAGDVLDRLDELVVPVRERYRGPEGWRRADLREDPGDFALFFVDVRPEVLARYGRRLLASERWLQRETKYAGVVDEDLEAALAELEEGREPGGEAGREPGREPCDPPWRPRFVADVREEYFSVLAHLLDSRYYRTHDDPGRPAPAGKYSAKRRGYVVSMGQDLGALKISGWTHTIPEYFDLGRFWERYPGAAAGDGAGPALRAHVWGMHHRYPTNSPALDAEGRGNPAGAHPFKAYNVLLMHNGEQVGVDSTSPFLREYGYVHADESMGRGRRALRGRLALRPQGAHRHRVRRLPDRLHAARPGPHHRGGLADRLADHRHRPRGDRARAPRRLELLGRNYVQLTPTGPYKFTIVESRPGEGDGRAAPESGGRRAIRARARSLSRRERRSRAAAPRRLSREHGHQVPAAPRARRLGRHRPRRRAGGGQRQRGQDRRRHAARAAPPGRAGRRRPRPALQHAPRRQPGARRVRRRGRGLPHAGRGRARSGQPLRRAGRGGAGGPQGVAGPPAPPRERRPRLARVRRRDPRRDRRGAAAGSRRRRQGAALPGARRLAARPRPRVSSTRPWRASPA